MSEQTFFHGLIIAWFLLAGIIFISLFYVAAPYGRHTRSGWGLAINNKLGWVIMEATAPLVFAICFVLGSNATTVTTLVFFSLWEIQYIHRAFIYPLTLRGSPKPMALALIISGLLFNSANAYMNGRYIFTLSAGYTNEWLVDPRFTVGVALFIAGFIINRSADHTLRSLRKAGELGYRIPYGKLYNWISCPNYFGEIVMWVGWALATWSLPGLAFALWTIANLLPRARSHQAWYHEHFHDYPSERKTLLPGIW